MKTLPDKFVIILNGKSCAGKSTTEKALTEQLPQVYNIGYDKLKWQLSNYHRDHHTALIKSIVLGLFEVVCKTGTPIILNSFCSKESEFLACQAIAKQYGYKIISAEVVAPPDVLLIRFRERIKSAAAAGSKISVTNEELFLKNNARAFFVPEGTPSFDSSVMSPDEIAGEIVKLILNQ